MISDSSTLPFETSISMLKFPRWLCVKPLHISFEHGQASAPLTETPRVFLLVEVEYLADIWAMPFSFSPFGRVRSNGNSQNTLVQQSKWCFAK